MTAAETRIHIIGVGVDGLPGLTSRARDLLQRADVIFGPDNTLALLSELPGERVRLGPDPQEAVAALNSRLNRGRLVLVASGDPLFYGVARYLCDRLGKDHFEVLPHVSSMQLAFARVKESWEDAYLTNLQTHPLDSVLDRIRTAEVVGLFPSESEGPAEIARRLLARGLDYFRVYVCENLGGPERKRVTQGELAEIAGDGVRPAQRRHPGAQSGPSRPSGDAGPLAPLRQSRRRLRPEPAQEWPYYDQAEVRAIALSRLIIEPGAVVWDIGAGSGSVAIEAARLSDPGMVYAIEQDAADYHLILSNARDDGRPQRQGRAWHRARRADGLPAPDAVFVGAVGREVGRVLEPAWKALRPGGQLVANIGSLESLNATYAELKRLAGSVDVLLVHLSRGVEQLESLRFEAVNPTFVLHVGK